MNQLKLRSIIVLNGDTNGSLAKHLQIAEQTFSSKINEKNGSEFTQGEITKIKEKYNLCAEEIDGIFFNQKVS